MIIKIFSSLILFLNFEILAQEYNYLKPSRDGIGKFYLDREISKVMGHLGASWLERNTREKEENSKLLVKNLNLNKEMVVADIGAGTGYYTSRMAKLSKLVYAVEIQQEMLILNKKNMLKEFYKRLIVPFYVPILMLVPYFLILSSKEKTNYSRLKLITFISGVIIIIFSEIGRAHV